MDISKEVKKIEALKKGNKEMAFFYEAGRWNLSVGNPSCYVMLGEVAGEFEVDGDSIEEVINKMKEILSKN